ncbi:glycosyltransferase [Streptomyces sp. SBR177]
MRVLFTGPAAAGHLFPMIPTAQALRAAGHEVLFASSRPLDRLRETGFPVVEIGDGRDIREVFEQATGEQARYVSPELTSEQILDRAASPSPSSPARRSRTSWGSPRPGARTCWCTTPSRPPPRWWRPSSRSLRRSRTSA